MADGNKIDGLFNLKASLPSEDEKSAFFSAAQDNDVSALDKLLRKFPDAALTWRNDSGEAVISASNKLQAKTLTFLLKAGADIDDKGVPEKPVWSAMHYAALRGNAPQLEMLLRYGAKVDIPDRYGRTPLMYAVDKESPVCADLLVLAGADPNSAGSAYSKSALDQCKSRQMRDVISAAQTRRADFLTGKPAAAKPSFVPPPPPAPGKSLEQIFALRSAFPTEDEQKAFFDAAEENDLRALRKTLERFPDAALNWRSDSGDAVIAIAARKIKPGTLEFLLGHGANIDDSGLPEKRTWSALHSAAYEGEVDRVSMLLRFGAKVDAPNKYGETPLMYAVDHEKPACADLLALAGADPDLIGSLYNKSAFDKCKSEKMREVIRAAQKKRADFMAGLPQAAKPVFVPPPAPVPDPATVKIVNRIDLRFKI